MKNWRIEFNEIRKFSPISVWVHNVPSDHPEIDAWCYASRYEPPFPKKVVSKGFPYLSVNIFNFDLEFASTQEVLHCIEILEQKNMPSTKNMVCPASTTYSGHNHWLATFPGEFKSWKRREKIVKVLKSTLRELQAEYVNF